MTPIVGETNATLTFASVTALNSTNYCVVITNSSGSVTSVMAGLTVFLPPQALNVQPDAAGVKILLTGTPGYPYFLQTATNLAPPVTWVSIVTNPADSDGNWQFVDTNLASPQRFYRAVVR